MELKRPIEVGLLNIKKKNNNYDNNKLSLILRHEYKRREKENHSPFNFPRQHCQLCMFHTEKKIIAYFDHPICLKS